jgi:hypothetical protein
MGALAVRMHHDPTVVGPRHHEEQVSVDAGLATAEDKLLDGSNPNPRGTTPTSRFGVVRNGSWNTVVQNGERPISIRASEGPETFVF